MATKAKTTVKATVKRTTLKDKIILLERERDYLRSENNTYNKIILNQRDSIDALQQKTSELLKEIYVLQEKLEQAEVSNRPWLLRVLGR